MSNGGSHKFGRSRAAFDAEAERGWFGFRNIPPIIVRSAGIVGAAATIMMVVSGGAWMSEPLRTTPATSASSSDEAVVEAALAPSASEPGEGEGAALITSAEIEPIIEPEATADAVEAVEPVVQVSEAPPPEAEIVATAEPIPPPEPDLPSAPAEAVEPVAAASTEQPDQVAPADVVADPAEGGVRVQTVIVPVESSDANLEFSVFEPPAMVAAFTPEEPAPQPAIAPPEVEAPAAAEPRPSPEPIAAEPAETPPALPEDEPVTVAAPTSVEAPVVDAAAAASASVEQPAASTENTEACGWIAGDDGAESTPTEECPDLDALTTDVPSADLAALDQAAVAHAEELAAVPRLPSARPEPPAEPIEAPPARRRTASIDMSWPDEPPPNCGSLHAYWRFVDEARTRKEWHCN